MEPILGKRLLSVSDVTRCEDLFHGDLGAQSLAFWEAMLTRGRGRGKTVVFRGQLIDLSVDDDRYLLLRPRRGVLEEAWFAQKDPVRPADADRYGIKVGSETFDVWKQEGAWDHPALEAYLGDLSEALPSNMHFAGLVQADGQVLIALGTDQDLFRFGGLITTKLNAQLEINRAFKDLAIAPKVAELWIGAANLPRS